jgi:hypothetical protein
MTTEKLKKDRKKVALDQSTYEKLKTFTRFNGLKLRCTVDTLVDLMLRDEALAKQVVELSLKKQADEAEL